MEPKTKLNIWSKPEIICLDIDKTSDGSGKLSGDPDGPGEIYS
jgi:hypothetical protein